MKICFATNNNNKLKEIRLLLGDHFEVLNLEDIGCLEDLPENQDTLEGNSLEKAQYVYEKYKFNCFADDTGLEVASLDGAPGVYSARFAGNHRNNEDNIRLLLEKLTDKRNRSAQFRTVISLIIDGSIQQFEGIVNGKIIESNKGTRGFGYDPVFLPNGYQRTFAEMTPEEKNKISHRGKAIRKLISFLKNNDYS